MPTTPGGLPYPSGTDPVANGAQDIQDLAEAVETFPGLRRIAGGTQSGTTALNVDSVFSNAYLNYRLLLSEIKISIADRAIRLNFRENGVTIASANYGYGYRGIREAGGSGDTSFASATFAEIGVFIATFPDLALGSASIDIMNPQTAERTLGLANGIGYEGGGFQFRNGGLVFNGVTSFDGFRISLSSTGNVSFKWDLYAYKR
jgi:hypothetical protein